MGMCMRWVFVGVGMRMWIFMLLGCVWRLVLDELQWLWVLVPRYILFAQLLHTHTQVLSTLYGLQMHMISPMSQTQPSPLPALPIYLHTSPPPPLAQPPPVRRSATPHECSGRLGEEGYVEGGEGWSAREGGRMYLRWRLW